jgi:drug/metabolite transporter (DMT)-like permease
VRAHVRAELVLLGVTLAWGGSFVLVKEAVASLGTFWLLTLRFALASAALALVFGRRAFDFGGATPRGAAWRSALLVGALLWAGFALQTAGLAITTPARSGFITGTYVAMVPLLARAFLGRALTRRVAIAVACAIAGLALLTDARGAGANLGDALTLLGALAFAAHLVALARWAPRLATPALTFVQLVAVGLCSLPFALAFGEAPQALPGGLALTLAYLGLVCSAGAYLGQTWGQRHTTPTRAALILSLESLFAALISVALGVEQLTPLQWLGGGLLLAGVIVGELPEPEEPRGDAEPA